MKKTHHLDVLVHMLTNVLNVDAVRVLLHALGEGVIGCLNLGKESLDTRKN